MNAGIAVKAGRFQSLAPSKPDSSAYSPRSSKDFGASYSVSPRSRASSGVAASNASFRVLYPPGDRLIGVSLRNIVHT